MIGFVIFFFAIVASMCVIPFAISRVIKHPIGGLVAFLTVLLNWIGLAILWLAIYSLLVASSGVELLPNKPGIWLHVALAVGGFLSWFAVRSRSHVSRTISESEVVSPVSPQSQASFHIRDSGEQRGPFALDQLQHMWRSGIITADSMYFDEPENEWKPLRGIINAADAVPASSLSAASATSSSATRKSGDIGCVPALLIILAVIMLLTWLMLRDWS